MMRRFTLGLAFVWTSATIVFLLVVSTLMLVQPAFPLNIGAIRTVGPAGLIATLVPAMAGIAGLVLFFGSNLRTGAWLVAAYSAFWAALMLSGLPAVWNARRSFCLKGLDFCIISPWVARLTVLGITLPFVISALVFLFARRAPVGRLSRPVSSSRVS